MHRPKLLPSPPGSTAGARAGTPLLLRPLARVTRISLFEREVRERLSRAALDVLLSSAAVMSEGQWSLRAGKEIFFGSTMLTIELETVASSLRDACDARAAQRVAALIETDKAALARIKTIAAAETLRIAGRPPRSLTSEVKVRARGITVFVDVDVEGSF
jgi:hypothetical protein